MDIVDQELERLRCPDPGPRDPSVLTMQDTYRSKRIWDNEVESRLRRGQLPCEAIMQLVRRAGLEGLVRVPFIQLDRALLTALIEQWRPETHSFHMRDAEITVTLQDVEVILGLPVDGDAVTGTFSATDVEALCTRLLGQVLRDKTERKGQKKARGFIMRLLGGTIFADHSGTLVHLGWLKLLDDFDAAGRKSWGSAALGWLYYGLCQGKRVGRVEGSPLIAKWDDEFNMPDIAKSVVGHYRHALDILRPEQVNWTPYDDELIDSLPAYCSTGRAIWRAHNRCFDFLRQPGLPQLTSQQIYGLGTIGLQYLAKLRTHVRKDLPVHGVLAAHADATQAQQVADEVDQFLEQHGVDVPFQADDQQGEFQPPQQKQQPHQQEGEFQGQQHQ
ncbi:hypothetical protein Vadar_005780 [Vaccinium darrowii]|uniref:Uncharacterized protein n=1 Tax=Vaccinium darrowii TaxID=229202 RepID=A0ACB7Y5G1_9ERIC|nr:hypothetical protein Vadar_005780 [Vaccinium darrowii]